MKPNVWKNLSGNFYVQRCAACLKENYAPMVAKGQCAWCGWKPGDALTNDVGILSEKDKTNE